MTLEPQPFVALLQHRTLGKIPADEFGPALEIVSVSFQPVRVKGDFIIATTPEQALALLKEHLPNHKLVAVENANDYAAKRNLRSLAAIFTRVH